jgi:phosphoglycolate phosphatase/putative hydrolase of the HAD superfamily
MDLTLYSNPAYGKLQIEKLVERLAQREGRPVPEMEAELEKDRRAWAGLHGGKAASLGSLFLSRGVTMEENIRWREECCEPEAFIGPDPRLRETLKALSAPYALGLLTNNPALTARRTLRALGVEDLFAALVALDTSGVSKPHVLPFTMAARALGAEPGDCVSNGDRYDIDLAQPLEMGLGAILVNGVEDVYTLQDVLPSEPEHSR